MHIPLDGSAEAKFRKAAQNAGIDKQGLIRRATFCPSGCKSNPNTEVEKCLHLRCMKFAKGGDQFNAYYLSRSAKGLAQRLGQRLNGGPVCGSLVKMDYDFGFGNRSEEFGQGDQCAANTVQSNRFMEQMN